MNPTTMPLLTVMQELAKRMTAEQLREAAAVVRALAARNTNEPADRAFYESTAGGIDKLANDREAEGANDRTEPDGIVRSAEVIYNGRVVDAFIDDDYDTVVRTGIEYVSNIAWDAAHDAFGDTPRKTASSVTLKFELHRGADLNAVATEKVQEVYPVLRENV